MAVGVDVIKTAGRIVFELRRGGEETTRTIDVPFPITDTESTELQTAVNNLNTRFVTTTSSYKYFMQPANWRDTNTAEEQWETVGVRYEVVTTATTPVTPDAPSQQG